MRLYLDPQSPYAYLAEARAAAVLGAEPELEIVALGVLFSRRGHGSWAHTGDRATHVAEVERRAAAAGLPPLTWPADWPAQTMAPVRNATWARRQGAGRDWLRAYWALVFAGGRPAGDPQTLSDATAAAGLDPAAIAEAIADPALKDDLRARTDAAWEAGVRGVPTLERDGRLYYGDDRLEEAAASSGESWVSS